MDITLSTPFGGRSLSVEMIDGQRFGASCDQELTADKWQILRDVTDCRKALELSDRTIAVLSALLSFHKDDQLVAEDNLIVFPCNKKLSARAYGISEPTLRRHLASLVKAGLLIRRDSPNGKRYARRDQNGEILRAFGFDLSPLLARAKRLHQMAEAKRQEARLIQSLKEDITIFRRDISKSLSYALNSDNSGPWINLSSSLAGLQQRTDRGLGLSALKQLHAALYALVQDVHNALDKFIFSKEVNGNHAQNERHIQDSNKNIYFDSEEINVFPQDCKTEENTKTIQVNSQAEDLSQLTNNSVNKQSTQKASQQKASTQDRTNAQHFDLMTILQACPKIIHCNRFGIRSWTDLIETADHVSHMLDISPSAWEDAKSELGLVTASVTVAAILERCDSIRSPGGYLRSLIAKQGFSPKAMIIALLSGSDRKSNHNRQIDLS